MDRSKNQDHFKRVEQKYLFPAGNKEMILTWLEHVCIHDPQYPLSDVSSLYYDTPGLFHFYESSNGEYVRAKVRLRWYADTRSLDPGAGVQCFLETKTKQGALSQKQRVAVNIPSQILFDDPFSSDQIRDLPERVYDLGYKGSGMLVPVLIVKYKRRRYFDPDSRSSIAVDTEIRCTQANGTFFQVTPPVYFDTGVMETKGMNRTTPAVLGTVGSCLTKSRFSKYGICLESLMQPLGRRV